MKKFSIHSLFIGIGIGMMFTALTNYFSMTNIIYSDNLTSDEKVVSNDMKNKNRSQNNVSIIEPSVTQEVYNDPRIDDNRITSITREHSIYISKGMTSKDIGNLLVEEGIIEDVQTFTKLASEKNVNHKLKYGLKKIPVGSKLEDILDILMAH